MLSRSNRMGIALLIQTISDAALYKHFVQRAASAVLYVVAASVMTTIAAAGLFFCIYRLLQRYGIDADNLAFIVTGIVALIAAILGCIAIRKVRRLKEAPPVISDLRDIISAAEGFSKGQ